MVISVPTGIKIFNWLATIWGGDVHFAVHDVVRGLLFNSSLPASPASCSRLLPLIAIDTSYFVVAHFHYVLVGAIVSLFGAFYYSYAAESNGRMMSRMLGKWHFWLFVIGFPSHV